METTERRVSARLEARAAVDGGEDLILEGYAAVFDVETQLWPGMVEVVRRGAFAESIQNDDQLAYWSHDNSQPLARKSAGTLLLEEDAKGLRVEIRMANTVINQDRYASVKRGNVQGMSIGFMVQPDGQTFSLRPNGTEVRELTRVTLFEVSPHADPQFPETELEARAKTAFAKKPQANEPGIPVEVAHAQARAQLMALTLE